MPVAANEVGRGSADDVVVGRTGLGLEVDVDGRHPIFFDHLLDHIPGVALIEACKQALCLELGDPAAELRDYEAEFLRVVEFDIPAVISADVTGANANFTVYQRGVASMVASAKISSSAGAAVQAR